MQNKPHKHAELIKAWADGAEIQWLNKVNGYWDDCYDCPTWSKDYEYRIKPEPKKDVCFHLTATTHLEGKDWWVSDCNKQKNLKLTFDGETGELKSAEVLK